MTKKRFYASTLCLTVYVALMTSQLITECIIEYYCDAGTLIMIYNSFSYRSYSRGYSRPVMEGIGYHIFCGAVPEIKCNFMYKYKNTKYLCSSIEAWFFWLFDGIRCHKIKKSLPCVRVESTNLTSIMCSLIYTTLSYALHGLLQIMNRSWPLCSKLLNTNV